MTIVWSDSAIKNLEEIATYIAKDDPVAAASLIKEIINSVETVLSDNPNSGRAGRVVGTREWVPHKNYVAAYRVKSGSIEILSIMHSARLWPSRF